jgi:hypothetical protein
MEKAIGEFLSSPQFGEMSTHKNLSVLPVFAGRNGGPVYRTLKEALQQGTLTISEVTDGGSALEHEGHVIHAAFFPVTSAEKIDPMAGYRRRRAYRTRDQGGTV